MMTTLKPYRSVVDFETEEALRKALGNLEVSYEVSTNLDWVLSCIDRENSEVQCMSQELRRLQVLKSYLILDSTREEAFDRLTGLAARFFHVPMAVISLVDLGRLWFMSSSGLGDLREGPRKDAFCAHAIQSKHDLFIVTDATNDFRFKSHFLVEGAANFRFYAAANLVSPEGYNLGTFCIIDTVPRPEGLSPDEMLSLRDFAELTVKEMVQRRKNLKEGPSPAELIAYMAHDLITPLTGIQLSLSVLNGDEEMKNSLSTHHQELLSTAVHCSELMSRICQTSVEALRSESSPSCPDCSPSNNWESSRKSATNMAELVRNLALLMDPVAKRVPLVIALDPMVPLIVDADDLKLFRAALNLISNCLSRTKIGLVHFRIFIKPGNCTRIFFECTDTGPEIKLEESETLFRPTLSPEGKVQLGLSSVAFLISSLNGEFGFRNLGEDHEGHIQGAPNGVLFWFSVPLSSPEQSGFCCDSLKSTILVHEEVGLRSTKSLTPVVAGPSSEVSKTIMKDPLMSFGVLPGTSVSPLLGATVSSSGNHSGAGGVGRNDSFGAMGRSKNSNTSMMSTGQQPQRFLAVVRDQSQSEVTNCKFLASTFDGLYRSLDSKLDEVNSAPPVANVPSHPSDEPVMKSSREKRRVLVIDDSLVIRKTLARALENLSFTVTQAVNGLQGLNCMKEQLFEFVMCDFLMPVMDGFDCVKQYRDWEKLNRPGFLQYIVGISAHAGASEREKGILSGMDQVRPKPVSVKSLTEIQKAANQAMNKFRRLDEIEHADSACLSAGSKLSMDQSQFLKSVDLQGMAQSSSSLSTRGVLSESVSARHIPSSMVQPSKLLKLDNGAALSQDQVSPACLFSTATPMQISNEVLAMLMQKGWQVVVAHDAQDALPLLKMRHWSAVFIYDDIPLLSGVDCIQEFRIWEQQNRVSRQHNVFMVCRGNVASVFEKGSFVQPPTGFDGVLGKPVKWKELDQILGMKRERSFDIIVEGRSGTNFLKQSVPSIT